MTQGQVAAKAGITPACLSKAELGRRYPRQAVLKRILDGLGVTYAALHRAQELVEDPMGERDAAIDAPDFTPEEAHQEAVRLAREAGKAVAHCCLAFMEVGARGWRLPADRGSVPESEPGPALTRPRGWRRRARRRQPPEVRVIITGCTGAATGAGTQPPALQRVRQTTAIAVAMFPGKPRRPACRETRAGEL